MRIEVWMERHGVLTLEDFECQYEADCYIQEKELWGWTVFEDSDDIEECTCI